MNSKVYFVKIVPDAIIPVRTNSTDAGMDLHSAENIVVPPEGGRRLVSTGLRIGIFPDHVRERLVWDEAQFDPEGENPTKEDFVWQAEVRARSGLAWKKGVTVLNSPGTVDCVAKGTMIQTLDGKKPVEDLFEKETVVPIFSYNEKDNIIEVDVISDMWIEEDREVVKLETEDGNSLIIASKKEVCTKRGWIKASELNLNDEILTF